MSNFSQTTTAEIPILLVAGSMRATNAMLAYVAGVLANSTGCRILVGDNPAGIDAHVVHICERRRLPYTCVGIAPAARNGARVYERFSTPLTGRAGYTARDCYLCERANEGVFVWNSVSPGTKAVYDYMVKLGKAALLWQAGIVNEGQGE